MKAASVAVCPEADEELFEEAVSGQLTCPAESDEMLNPKYWRPNREENKVFTDIDRAEENRMVTEFQQTGDEAIYTKLYVMREPTLWVWARKFYYLDDSEEDLFAALRPIWIKAIHKYSILPKQRVLKARNGSILRDKRGRARKVFKVTDFNTLLFTYCQNYCINLWKKKFKTKKRMDDNGQPACNTTLSLDARGGPAQGGTDENGRSMHETIPDDKWVDASENIGANWIIDQVSNGDQQVRDVLERYANDPSYNLLSKASQVSRGSLRIRKNDRRIFWRGGVAAQERMTDLIRKSRRFKKGFKLLNWQAGPYRVNYEVEVNDWDLYERVLKAIRLSKGKILAEFGPDASTEAADVLQSHSV